MILCCHCSFLMSYFLRLTSSQFPKKSRKQRNQSFLTQCALSFWRVFFQRTHLLRGKSSARWFCGENGSLFSLYCLSQNKGKAINDVTNGTRTRTWSPERGLFSDFSRQKWQTQYFGKMLNHGVRLHNLIDRSQFLKLYRLQKNDSQSQFSTKKTKLTKWLFRYIASNLLSWKSDFVTLVLF